MYLACIVRNGLVFEKMNLERVVGEEEEQDEVAQVGQEMII